MSLKRTHDVSQETDTKSYQDSQDIFESLPIEDRKSKFVAAFSSKIPAKELQAHGSYKSASHRILAWRGPSNQQSLINFKGIDNKTKQVYTTGYDDDGESYAGKKLEKVLIDHDIVGAIVVARWYGGVLLGPVRFTHMEQVARDAITKWRDSLGPAIPSKRPKTETVIEMTPEQEAQEKIRLVKLLTNRDNSVKVLRELLAEKKKSTTTKDVEAAGAQSAKDAQPPRSTPSSVLDYSHMPWSRLKQLEKARDTTISWILKQIDEAESEAGTITAGASIKPNAA